MEHKPTINVLIATEQASQSEHLLNLLRKEGYAIHAELLSDEASLRESLQQGRWDVLFLFAGASELNVAHINSGIEEAAQDLCLLLLSPPSIDADQLSTLSRQWVQCCESLLDTPNGITSFLTTISRELDSLFTRRELRQISVTHKALQQRYQLLLENASDAVAYLNEGLHVYANHAYSTLFGFDSEDELKQHTLLDLVDERDVDTVREYLQNASANTNTPCVFLGITAPNSRTRLSLQCAKSLYNDEVILQVLLRLATGNIEQQQRIKSQEGRDLLTDLLNRNAINTLIDLAIANSVYEQRNSAVLLLKIEEFKDLELVAAKSAVNALLADAGKVLQENVPQDASIGHYGEGEFIIVLSHETEFAQDQFLASLTETLNTWLKAHSVQGTSLSFSAGMAVVNELSPSSSVVIDRARHNLTIRSSLLNINELPLTDPYGTADEMFERLQNAFEQEDFLLVFQPVVNLKEDGVERYEVRIRLQDNENLIYPPRFLELANQHGLGERIDRWVCSQSLSLLRNRNSEALKLTINLTHNSIVSSEFLPWLLKAMHQENIAANQISLQISELDIASSPTQVQKFCEQMKSFGFILSITHYGCTFSPSNTIPLEMASIIKLDRSLLDKIDTDLEQREKLNTTVSSLHARGLLVIAPMIDKIDLLPYLWKANINFVQGNCLQEPSENMDFSFVQDEELTLDSFH